MGVQAASETVSMASRCIQTDSGVRTFPPFRLDPVNQCLWRTDDQAGERRLELRPKTFEVLAYLVAQAGRLVTHAELLDALWKDDVVQPEVIKAHVLALRKVLGDHPDSPRFIQTLPRRGYRFVAPVGVTASIALTGFRDGAWQTVGRSEPMRQLATFMQRADSGARQLVFLSGERGLGKTTLIEEFCKRAEADCGACVTMGQCVERHGAGAAHYPLFEALGRLCTIPYGAAVVDALTDLAPTWAVQMPSQVPAERRRLLQRQIIGQASEHMIRELCELLESLARHRLLLLVLEDLHWADDATIDFLAAAARRQLPARLMIVATYRPEEAATACHPLLEMSRELLVRDMCQEIPLEPLTPDAVAQLLSDEPDAAFVRLLCSQSGGNPLFMRALLSSWMAHDLVSRTEAVWRPRAPLDQMGLVIPHALVQLIEARVRQLSAEERRVLEAASVAGLTFTPLMTARAADMSPEPFEAVCETLCNRRSFIRRTLTLMPPGQPVTQAYEFAHPLCRQVFFERQGPIRRSRAHNDIAACLEAARHAGTGEPGNADKSCVADRTEPGMSPFLPVDAPS
jgi:DNA-binding winged helix-turn-helix (wHTH) protein